MKNDIFSSKQKFEQGGIWNVYGTLSFRYVKIQPKTIDLSTRLWEINPTNFVSIPQSLVLRSIVLG